jgi:hypothetical protein
MRDRNIRLSIFLSKIFLSALCDVAYGKEMFVAVGNWSAILASLDVVTSSFLGFPMRACSCPCQSILSCRNFEARRASEIASKSEE